MTFRLLKAKLRIRKAESKRKQWLHVVCVVITVAEKNAFRIPSHLSIRSFVVVVIGWIILNLFLPADRQLA